MAREWGERKLGTKMNGKGRGIGEGMSKGVGKDNRSSGDCRRGNRVEQRGGGGDGCLRAGWQRRLMVMG
ncbi:hypothetical protein CsSME_00022386 [Camellia sinensis var. sinensis]